jgi:hypothetical protein
MEKPIISLVCSAIRDYRYKDYYNSASLNNKVPFEVVFVGNRPPKDKMPDNFRYIETDVRPTQCYEIAMRNSHGQYANFIPDDFIFPPNYLNNLYKYTLILDMNKVLLSVRGCHPGGRKRNRNNIDHGMVFDSFAPNAPFCGLDPLFRKDIWIKLGGMDRRFHGDWGMMDMQRRFYEYGMNPFIVPECILGEKAFFAKDENNKDKPSLCQLTYDHDVTQLMRTLWFKEDGSVSKNRLVPVQSFRDEDILMTNQF